MTDEELFLRHIQRIVFGIPSPVVDTRPTPSIATIKPDGPRPIEEIQCAPPGETLH
jgi:hypothetical protein